MTRKLISFQVRAKDEASLAEVASRVEQALMCSFTPSNSEQFEGSEGLETEVLGFRITLTYWPSIEDTERRNYWLTGVASEELLAEGGDVIDVSEFILTVLTKRDKGKWYIPTLKEKYLEAGLPWTDK